MKGSFVPEDPILRGQPHRVVIYAQRELCAFEVPYHLLLVHLACTILLLLKLLAWFVPCTIVVLTLFRSVLLVHFVPNPSQRTSRLVLQGSIALRGQSLRFHVQSERIFTSTPATHDSSDFLMFRASRYSPNACSVHQESIAQCQASQAPQVPAQSSQPTCAGDCVAGFLCALSASSPSPGGGVVVGNVLRHLFELTLQISSNINGLCPMGSYCVQGTQSPTPCPMGTYSLSVGLGSLSACSQCRPGYFCNDTGTLLPCSLTTKGRPLLSVFACPDIIVQVATIAQILQTLSVLEVTNLACVF